jgi:uncharacterized membrane protein YGL010W
MLRLQLLFFASLAVGAGLLAWGSHCVAARATASQFALFSAACWLLATVLLFLGLSAFTPNEPALFFPTLAAALAGPMLAMAATVAIVRNRLSREQKLFLMLLLSAAFAFFAAVFILAATCIVQANCL